MAVSEAELRRAARILSDFGATRVYVFGSAARAPEQAGDIDIACEGIPPARYYAAVGAVIAGLGRDVDVLDLRDDPLSRLVLAEARRIDDH